MAKLSRTSFTLPPEMVRDLAYISARVGVSRSALLADLSAEPIADLRRLLEAIPPSPTPADVLRLRGESEALIMSRLANLRQVWEGDLAGGSRNE